MCDIIKLSTRPENRVGSDEIWDKAEQALQVAVEDKDLDWELQPGEGAFYGPKIDFSLRDCIGRVWQCGTIQADFSMPGRLGAQYVDENSDKQVPVMLHRAILGSMGFPTDSPNFAPSKFIAQKESDFENEWERGAA